MKTYMYFCAWKWPWNHLGGRGSPARQVPDTLPTQPCEGNPPWSHHHPVMQASCPHKGYWLQTTLISLTPVTKVKGHVLTEQQPPITTHTSYNRAFVNWKSRGNNSEHARIVTLCIHFLTYYFIEDDNGASRCAAGQCCVIKFLVAEGISSFQIYQQLPAVIKKTLVTVQGTWTICVFLGSLEVCFWWCHNWCAVHCCHWSKFAMLRPAFSKN
jgi:hypothetical protein